MNSLNKVQIIGNVTMEPEVKQTPSGQYVANLNIATNRTWKDASGMKQEQTEFHPVVIWGKLAEIVQQYVQKGKKIYIEGRLQTRNWEDQAGQKRYKTEIVADNIILLGAPGGKNEDFGDSYSSSDSEDISPSKTKKSIPKPEQEINIEDIPF
ncbi:MAG: single-stranded DNA-binding protein [Candidatus Gracilibacteria bacterium]|nr:single-stranded DNA-binding protein [Candidatus Gracilibacteria bacterium]MDD2909023.1 single-stranded DNA-binding protein [Candidatus Gracilibacteria bacterium]